MTIKQLPAVREEFLSGSDSLFEFKADDPRKIVPVSLEYKKKQAKQLLKKLKAVDQETHQQVHQDMWMQIHKSHPNSEALTPENIKLSDVQWVIAKESGFSSWAVLKHHIEASKIAIDAIKSDQPSSLVLHQLRFDGYSES